MSYRQARKSVVAIVVVDHELAKANRRSSNKPPWPRALQSRKTKFANPDARVANKEAGRDESGRHLDLRATCDRALIHSWVFMPPPTTSAPRRHRCDRNIGPLL